MTLRPERGRVRKQYVGDFARERAHDELVALEACRRNGLKAPEVVAASLVRNPTIEMTYIPSMSFQGRCWQDVDWLAEHALLYLKQLRVISNPTRAGFGWLASWQDVFDDAGDFACHLIPEGLEQLEGGRGSRFTDLLRSVLRERPLALLHGDVKPAHMFGGGEDAVPGRAQLALIDWESASRGADVLDVADLCWRLARDISGVAGPTGVHSLTRVVGRASESIGASQEELCVALGFSALKWSVRRGQAERQIADLVVARLLSADRDDLAAELMTAALKPLP